MSMSSNTLEFRGCRIVGTLEFHGNSTETSVCQIDCDLTCENAARVLASLDSGPPVGPHNHYDNTPGRVWESLRAMAARHSAPVDPFPWQECGHE